MFDKLKKAFGFGPIDDNDELIADDPENDAIRTDVDTDAPQVSEGDVENIVTEIFEHVVLQFNDALPGFLKETVDAEREKKFLYQTLHEDVKAHLRLLEESVNRRVGDSWRTEREKMQSDLKSLSKTAKEIEAKRNELRNQQLSSERQKRAMTERIHELERQLLASEAEKEQLELENKSMLNKVKVSQVYEKELNELREQVSQMQNELIDSKVTGTTTAESSEPAVVKETVDPNPELLLKIESLEKEKTELTSRIEQLSRFEKENDELLDKMEKAVEKIQSMEEETAAKSAKIKTLTRDLESTRRELESAKQELESHRDPIDMSEVSLAMNDVDDVVADTDWIVQPAQNRKEKRQNEKKKQRNPEPRDDGQMSLW